MPPDIIAVSGITSFLTGSPAFPLSTYTLPPPCFSRSTSTSKVINSHPIIKCSFRVCMIFQWPQQKWVIRRPIRQDRRQKNCPRMRGSVLSWEVSLFRLQAGLFEKPKPASSPSWDALAWLISLLPATPLRWFNIKKMRNSLWASMRAAPINEGVDFCSFVTGVKLRYNLSASSPTTQE